MKNLILFLTLASVAFGQEVEDGPIDDIPSAVMEMAPKPRSTDQRNWIFAAGSAVAAAIAIAVVAINPGEGPASANGHY